MDSSRVHPKVLKSKHLSRRVRVVLRARNDDAPLLPCRGWHLLCDLAAE
jgi:hypothetical protein